MSHALIPGLKRTAHISIRKTRELPLRGEILVHIGDWVESSQIVGKASLPGELVIVRLPEQMGIEVFEVLKGLKVKVGEEVKKEHLLCEYVGLWGLLKSRFYSRHQGVIEIVSQETGHLGIRLASIPVEIKSYLSGKVVEIEEGKSAVIEAHATYVQGIFGVGGEKLGKLLMLDVPLNHKLTPSDIPLACAGAVLIGGTSPNYESLKKASEAGAVGLVVGSIDDEALKSYLGYDLGIALTGDEDISMTLIATEGFGYIPMEGKIYELLHPHNGKIVSINGATQVRAGAVRPEIAVCHNKEYISECPSHENQQAEEGLVLGGKVRVIRFPYFGLKGKVITLPQELNRIETGAFTRVLELDLEDGRKVVVPRANVELM